VLNERCHRNPSAGGVEVSLFERFGRLTQRGFEVELLCSGFPSATASEEHRGVRVTRVGSRLSYYTKVPGEVRRRVRAGHVDVVIEELSKVPFLTPLYAEVPVLAVHHHLHGFTAFRQVSPVLAVGSVALEALIPWIYRRVPIITVSKSSKSDLVRRGLPEEQIDVVPSGLDHDLLRPAMIPGRAPLIVSLGRLEPYKRLDLLLRAMPSVLAEVPAARLAILGRGQDEARLRRLVARLGLQASVSFEGFVTDAEKAAWLRSAALHVQCSTKEGWGLSVLEAGACGTPVVATDVPGLSDSVQDGVTGLLVRRARPQPLAAAISRLLCDDAERSRLGHNALAWSRNFRWEPFAAALESSVRRLSAQAAPSDIEMPAALAAAGTSP
jgi:glycosyltransferase involved in cell wall biosynthesis